MSTKPFARYRHAALAVAALALALTGCRGDGSEADGDPTEVPSTSTATPTETETTADTSWRTEYDEEQLQAYEAALQRVDDYEQTSEAIWREGIATPEAEALFAEYWLVPQVPYGQLQTFEQAGVQLSNRPTVLDSRATRIALSEGGQSVTIDQCVDYTDQVALQRGTPAPTTETAVQGPRLRTVQVDRFVGERETPWQLSEINGYEGAEPC